jgi:Na+-transporting methylmalonyl-CoA/oxaloacetate decarboxylase gamma subunit
MVISLYKKYAPVAVMSSINEALQITVIGMSLVFGAILILWGVISLLVYLTRQHTRHEVIESEAELTRKKLAAIAAITIALASELDTQPHEFPIPTSTVVSPWQSVMRAKMLNKRGPVQ